MLALFHGLGLPKHRVMSNRQVNVNLARSSADENIASAVRRGKRATFSIWETNISAGFLHSAEHARRQHHGKPPGLKQLLLHIFYTKEISGKSDTGDCRAFMHCLKEK